MSPPLSDQMEGARRELTAYLSRLVLRPQVADELVQTTFLRALESVQHLPPSVEGVRAWLFRVATNLAIDERRRHGNWRETLLHDLRDVAVADPDYVARSRALSGSPETRAIAREHVVTCIACTLANLPEHRAAALLLKEVHGFTLTETAELLGASAVQVKNWLQEARAHMDTHYGQTCALLTKNGVCHQCTELDGFMAAHQGNPLNDDASLDARLRIATELRGQPWGPWHRMMFDLVDELA